jgi:gluconate:H+ symporter, GntP family
MSDFIRTSMTGFNWGIFLPFIVSAAIKTAQGSSTVAMITTSAIFAPLLAGLGLHPVMTTLAIGAGSMVVSHANDSYFWVVSQFSGMEVSTAYKAYTTATLVEGLTAMIAIAGMACFLPF